MSRKINNIERGHLLRSYNRASKYGYTKPNRVPTEQEMRNYNSVMSSKWAMAENLRMAKNVLKNPVNREARVRSITAEQNHGNNKYKRLFNSSLPPTKKKSWWSARKTRRSKKNRSTRKRK